MNLGADVRSLDQLQALRERCTLSRVQTLKEAEALQAELQKLTQWLEDEVANHWQQQNSLAERRWHECREALMRCEATVRASEKRPCTDERKRLELATARRQFCQQQLRVVREAQLLWQKQVVKIKGRLQHAVDQAEGDLLVTVHQLDEIVSTLAAYMRVSTDRPPEAPSETA